MKVLHVFTLSGTAEAFFDGQFGYLSRCGHKITVAAGDDLNPDFAVRNHVGGIRFLIERRISPLADIRSIWFLRRLIRKEGFDVVVGHTPKGAMVGMIAARFAGTRHRVYYRHGLIYTTAAGLRRLILKSVERMTGAFATKIVNVSPSLCELAVRDRLNDAGKQTIIGNGTCGGIDTVRLFNPERVAVSDREEVMMRLGIGTGDFVAGFCGRICKEKGIRELVDGFSLFRERCPGVSAKLLLVGGYDGRDVLPQEYRDRIDGDPDIISTGSLPKQVLPLYYSLMDVFVFPSYREGFGMSVIEAGAMGVPALVSRSHGCVDSIQEGFTGYYIEISADDIAQGLSRMLGKCGGELKRLGITAREFVTENFSDDVLWPKVRAWYDELGRSRK